MEIRYYISYGLDRTRDSYRCREKGLNNDSVRAPESSVTPLHCGARGFETGVPDRSTRFL